MVLLGKDLKFKIPEWQMTAPYVLIAFIVFGNIAFATWLIFHEQFWSAMWFLISTLMVCVAYNVKTGQLLSLAKRSNNLNQQMLNDIKDLLEIFQNYVKWSESETEVNAAKVIKIIEELRNRWTE